MDLVREYLGITGGQAAKGVAVAGPAVHTQSLQQLSEDIEVQFAGAPIQPVNDFAGDLRGYMRITVPIATHPQNWETHSVINQAKQLKDTELNIVIDCGRKDFFLEVNRALHQQLLDDGISHVYEEHAGGHSWDYWKRAIKRQIPYIATQFKNAD